MTTFVRLCVALAAVTLVLSVPMIPTVPTVPQICTDRNGKVRKLNEKWTKKTPAGVESECTCEPTMTPWSRWAEFPPHIECHLLRHCLVDKKLRRLHEIWTKADGSRCKCGMYQRPLIMDTSIVPARFPSERCWKRVCPAFWENSGKHCYTVMPCMKRSCSPSDGSQLCASFGGKLARVRSDDIVKLLLASVKKHSALGLNTLRFIVVDGTDKSNEGQWVYGDGSSMQYTNWYRNRPTVNRGRNCILSFVNRRWSRVNGKWRDARCRRSFPRRFMSFACETRASWGKPRPHPLFLGY